MNLQEIKAALETGFADADAALNFVTEAIPVLEQIPAVGAVAPEINDVLTAANNLKPIITGILQSGGIAVDTHDALQSRVTAVVDAQTPVPVEEIGTPAPTGGLT